jgi:Helix-turn-helix domain
MTATFNAHSEAVIEALAAGASLAEAASEAGVGRRTVDRWLASGRRGEEPYAAFAARVAAARAIRADASDAEHLNCSGRSGTAGAVSAALRSLLDGAKLDPGERVIAAAAVAVAAKLDAAVASDAAMAATATPPLARQLLELLRALPPRSNHIDAALAALERGRRRSWPSSSGR